MSWPIGTYVRLNSGGPEMIVVDFVGPSSFVAAWIDCGGNVNESVFPWLCVHPISHDMELNGG